MVVSLPGEKFPQAWILIERICRSMANLANDDKDQLQRGTRDNNTTLDTDPSALSADIESIGQRAAAWVRRAVEAGLDNPTSEEISTEFISWLEPLSADSRFRIRYLVQRAVKSGMSAAINFCGGSPGAAAVVPVIYMNCLEDEHSLTEVDTFAIEVAPPTRRIATTHHQMLGHAPTSQNIDPRSANDVLLLHLESDRGVDFMFCDCGELQFWIDADDLVARRFDRVKANTQGG